VDQIRQIVPNAYGLHWVASGNSGGLDPEPTFGATDTVLIHEVIATILRMD
jgi:hypothetical protein